MADTVQVMMEKMIPELEDLQEKKIFSKGEIRQIVDRRRDFEYMMKRIPLRAIDALRYIEYELNLDALRRKRKERLGLRKPAPLSDNAGTRRVHSIFDRVLYKHRGSLDLWLQYIAFCKTEGSSRILSRVFSRALQVHPRSAEIWIEAAGYEFTANLNVDSARVLLQRAIRITPQCARLWHEYFRLELLYIQKLTLRREILRLDEAAPQQKPESEDDGSTVLIEPLAEEKQASGVEILDEQQAAKLRARQQILDGAIARIIYTNAVAAIPKDVAFRLKFVEISDLFGRAFAANLSQFILQSCREDFPQNEYVHMVHALRPLVRSAVRSCDDMEMADEQQQQAAEKQAIANLEASVTSLATVEMSERFADWLVERLASPAKTSELVAYASAKLKEMAFTQSPASAKVAIRYVDLVHRTEGAKRAHEAAHELCDARFSTSADLWLLQSQLVFHLDGVQPTRSTASIKRRRTAKGASSAADKDASSPLDKAIAILRVAIAKLDKADVNGQTAVRRRLIQLLVSKDALTPSSEAEAVQSAFKDALRAVEPSSTQWNELRREYVAWAATSLPIEQVRALYGKFLVDSQLLPTHETLAFLRLCVNVETSVSPSARVDMAQVRALFERVVDLFGASREDVWVDYISTLAGPALNRVADAARVHQRAVRAWPESPALSQLSLNGAQ